VDPWPLLSLSPNDRWIGDHRRVFHRPSATWLELPRPKAWASYHQLEWIGFSPDSCQLLVKRAAGGLPYRPLLTWYHLAELETGPVAALAMSTHPGKAVVGGSRMARLRFLDGGKEFRPVEIRISAKDGDGSRQRLEMDLGASWLACFSSDDRFLAVRSGLRASGRGEWVVIFDLDSGERYRHLSGVLTDGRIRFSFLPGNELLVTVGYPMLPPPGANHPGERAEVRCIRTGELVAAHDNLHGRGVEPTSFAPDGRTFFLRPESDQIQLVDVRQAERYEALRLPEIRGRALRFSLDGRQLLATDPSRRQVDAFELEDLRRRARGGSSPLP
jgi:hypothetical protein